MAAPGICAWIRSTKATGMGSKGVSHINAVDEVTQLEIVCSVEKISERSLIPVLADLLDQFPFLILAFHADSL